MPVMGKKGIEHIEEFGSRNVEVGNKLRIADLRKGNNFVI